MSGLSADKRTYELTPTKGSYWHRHRSTCRCQDLDEIYETHLIPAGFRRVPARYVNTYEHPEHDRFPDGLLWEAISGRPSDTGPYDTRF